MSHKSEMAGPFNRSDTIISEHFTFIQQLKGKMKICNNLLLYESDVMQGGCYAVSISLVVQSMVA